MSRIRVVAHQAIAGVVRRGSRSALIVVGIALGTGFVSFTRIGCRVFEQLGNTIELERNYWFAVVALFMTVVGVGNAMAISVSERTKEIGTLKCLGATNGLVASIYFAEAVSLSIVGSVCGSIAGSYLAGITYGVRLDWGQVAASLSIGLTASVVSALLPALVASRMEPVAAMRTEV